MPLLAIDVPQAFIDLCHDDDVDPVDVLRDLVASLMEPMDPFDVARLTGSHDPNEPGH